jgi:hypothetical protein
MTASAPLPATVEQRYSSGGGTRTPDVFSGWSVVVDMVICAMSMIVSTNDCD